MPKPHQFNLICSPEGPTSAEEDSVIRPDQAEPRRANDRVSKPIEPTLGEGKTPMRCPRCHSVAVQEVFVDYGSSSTSFPGYRCVICGDISDATILRHRMVPQPVPLENHRRPRTSKLKTSRNTSRSSQPERCHT